MKDWLPRLNWNKKKSVVSRIIHLMCSFVLLLIISLRLVTSCGKCLPSWLLFNWLLRITFAVLQKPCQGNFWKFQGLGKSRFGCFEKDCYFLKIPKWQHEFVRNFKRGKLISYFLNNAAKTCLCGLKISENIDIRVQI